MTLAISDADYYSDANYYAGVTTDSAISRTFRSFIGRVSPKFQFYKHCEILIDVCERIASGELKRVMVQLPPRHTKSEMFSRLFSAYYLSRHPDHFVGLNSYAAELAYTLSRSSRENYIRSGALVKDDAAAVKHWETVEGGGMWAAGVGGPITGKGFHLGIIDDPIKNAEEANSEIIREKHKEWYKTTFLSREEPDAAIVIIQTRWHEDDLTGWLLSEEENSEDDAERERWHIVCFPAVYEEDMAFPPTCTVEADFRAPGEPLCPERYDLPKLANKQAKGEREWLALYQQRPTAKQGLFFHIDRLQIVDAAPVQAFRARGWDQAATEGDGDWTAGVKIAKDHDGIYYVEDVIRGQWDTATRDRMIRQTAVLDGVACKQIGEQEPGSGGKQSAQSFVRLLAGFPVSTEAATNAKEVRADPYSSQVNAGNVKLVKGHWNKDYIEELRQFPLGKHDDQVDGSSLAFNRISRFVHIPDVTDAERLEQAMPHEYRIATMLQKTGQKHLTDTQQIAREIMEAEVRERVNIQRSEPDFLYKDNPYTEERRDYDGY